MNTCEQPIRSFVAARNARNRRAGARWQTELRDGIRGAGFDIERLTLAGTQDEGDHVIRLPEGQFLVLEAKAGTMHPAEFVRQAQIEATNFAQHRRLDPQQVKGIVVVKRRGANWRDAYVLTTLDEYLNLSRNSANHSNRSAADEPTSE